MLYTDIWVSMGTELGSARREAELGPYWINESLVKMGESELFYILEHKGRHNIFVPRRHKGEKRGDNQGGGGQRKHDEVEGLPASATINPGRFFERERDGMREQNWFNRGLRGWHGCDKQKETKETTAGRRDRKCPLFSWLSYVQSLLGLSLV
jgi:hypothetical protein